MPSRPALLLSLLVLFALGGLGTGAWLLLRTPDGPRPLAPEVSIGPRPGPLEPAPGATPRLESVVENPTHAANRVAFPLELELELLRADASVSAPGVPPLGSAATARLRGSVFSGVGTPVAAEVRFEAGPNQGRVLQCDSTGRFGATDLYPGLAVVRVRGVNIVGSQRIVRLRQKTESEFNLGYGRLTEVTGEVQTREGQALAGAKVSFDGQEAETDERGVFHFDGVASGQVLVLVQKAGYASVQEELSVPAGKKIERGQLRYALDKGARIVVHLPDRIRGDVQALCFLGADKGQGSQRNYPWFLVNPVKIWPGGEQTIEDLPPGNVWLRVFHSGAQSKPRMKTVALGPAAEVDVTIEFEPAPTIHGTVTRGGTPVNRAEITLEAADRLRATLAAFDAPNEFFVESDVRPDAPPAVEVALSDAAGHYEISSWESAAKERYLVARADGGRLVATRILRGGESEVNLELAAASAGDGLLRLTLPERTQVLPVRIAVNGERRQPIELPPGQDLRVPDLVRGRWKLSARWNGEVLANGKELEVLGETALPLDLPEGAIAGQDAQTQKRASGLK